MKIDALEPELLVENVEETCTFYTQFLKAEIIDTEKEHDKWVWAKVDLGKGVSLSFKDHEKIVKEYSFFPKTVGGTISLCFSIHEISELFHSIKGHVKIVNPLHKTDCQLMEFSILDNNGYILTFLEA